MRPVTTSAAPDTTRKFTLCGRSAPVAVAGRELVRCSRSERRELGHRHGLLGDRARRPLPRARRSTSGAASTTSTASTTISSATSTGAGCLDDLGGLDDDLSGAGLGLGRERRGRLGGRRRLGCGLGDPGPGPGLVGLGSYRLGLGRRHRRVGRVGRALGPGRQRPLGLGSRGIRRRSAEQIRRGSGDHRLRGCRSRRPGRPRRRAPSSGAVSGSGRMKRGNDAGGGTADLGASGRAKRPVGAGREPSARPGAVVQSGGAGGASATALQLGRVMAVAVDSCADPLSVLTAAAAATVEGRGDMGGSDGSGRGVAGASTTAGASHAGRLDTAGRLRRGSPAPLVASRPPAARAGRHRRRGGRPGAQGGRGHLQGAARRVCGGQHVRGAAERAAESEEPRMSSQAPLEVAPPSPVAGAVTGRRCRLR